jgi:hypothetical protein
VAKIHLGQMEYFELGNLDSMRDWGHAKVSKNLSTNSSIKNYFSKRFVIFSLKGKDKILVYFQLKVRVWAFFSMKTSFSAIPESAKQFKIPVPISIIFSI